MTIQNVMLYIFCFYTGQKITFHNAMESNDTHAHRDTTVTYISKDNQIVSFLKSYATLFSCAL